MLTTKFFDSSIKGFWLNSPFTKDINEILLLPSSKKAILSN